MELVKVRNIFGQQVTVIKDDLIGRKIIKHGAYDKTGLYFIDGLLSKIESPVCLDIGANIGNHLLVMARKAKRAIAFEPQPEVFAVLKINAQDNKLKNVSLQNYGLSNMAGFASMGVVDSTNTGATTFANTGSGGSIKAELRIGDDEIQKLNIENIDFIKIDVEGLEVSVIEGLQGAIKKAMPFVMLEWNCDDTKIGFREKKIFSEIFAGYKVYAVTSSHEKPFGGETAVRKLRRKISRSLFKPTIKLTEFEESRDYGNIVLVPSMRSSLVDTYLK